MHAFPGAAVASSDVWSTVAPTATGAGRARSTIVIPARLASTRLPRKLLLCETGKPLIQHTHEAACRARRPSGVCVAADHEEIAAAVRAFGGEARMTSPDCASGTDRVAEVARAMPEVDIFVNVQGDEPEISGAAIDQVIELLEGDPTAVMATLATPIRTRDKLHDPACVKVAFARPTPLGGADSTGSTDSAPIAHSARSAASAPAAAQGGRAIYFSRSPIPHPRLWDDALLTAEPAAFFQHIGLYAYRRDFLLRMASLPRTPLEKLENLEQLRVLEWGYAILVGVIDEPTIGVDTPEDYRAFVERTRGR